MKSPRIEPIWMSGIGLVIAPLACGFNAALVTVFLNHSDLKTGLQNFLLTMVLTPLICFPLGLLSENVLKFWNAGRTKTAKWLSALCGGGTLVLANAVSEGRILHALISSSARQPLTGEVYVAVAALLIPFLWALLLLIFAIFARTSK